MENAKRSWGYELPPTAELVKDKFYAWIYARPFDRLTVSVLLRYGRSCGSMALSLDGALPAAFRSPVRILSGRKKSWANARSRQMYEIVDIQRRPGGGRLKM